MSEVRTNLRTAITLPEHSWARFRDILNEYVEHSSAAAAGAAAAIEDGDNSLSASQKTADDEEVSTGEVAAQIEQISIKDDTAVSNDAE